LLQKLHSYFDDAFALLKNLLLNLRLCSDDAFALLRDLLLDFRLHIKLCSRFIVILTLEIDALFS